MTRSLLLAALLLQQAPAPPGNSAAPVVAAVTAAARENAALPEGRRATGDALGDLYARRAAAAAKGDARAFVVGLAHALDPAATLARHPLTAAAFRGIETAEEAKARKEVLGRPSLRGRNDLLLHFASSAAVAALAGAQAAESGGIAKEVADSRGGSGFSFADLLADLAGIRYAAWLLEGDGQGRLERAAREFSGEAFLPDPTKEAEGLQEKEFAERFGSTADDRFRARLKGLREAVAALPIYSAERETPPR